MFKKHYRLFSYLMIVLFVAAGSCKSKYDKLKASTDHPKQYQEGIKYYNKKEYVKALGLFEPLISIFRGHENVEDLFYYYAMTNYKLKDYTSAAYSFKQFADSYPSDARAEECRYMTAYCYYLDAPNFSLDQDNTHKAIDRMQLFINLYPKSDRVVEANKLIQELHGRLEQKSFENAKLYYILTEYQSAVIAMNNSLRDYPDTKYAEDLQYLLVKAQYDYASHSREDKQEDRYNQTMGYADEFLEKNPGSKYVAEVKQLKAGSQGGIQKAKAYLAAVAVDQKLANKMAKKDTVKAAPRAEAINDAQKIPN